MLIRRPFASAPLALVAVLFGASCDFAPELDLSRIGAANVELSSTPGQPSGAVSPTIDPAQQAIAHVNAARAASGLEPMKLSDHLADSARLHAEYLALHRAVYDTQGVSAHVQLEGLPGYTGASFVDRADAAGYEGHALAEVVARRPTPVAAVESWLESLYHRLPLLSAAAVEVGYGESSGDLIQTNVMELGALPERDTAADPVFVRYPSDGQLEVAGAWDGNEIPQPEPPPAGYPSGPVVTLQVSGHDAITWGAASVRRAGSQSELISTVLTRANDSHLGERSIAVIPQRPLLPETAYEVSIAGTRNGEAFVQRWSFTTRREGCDLFTQDCGPGRGCYLVDGTPSCHWSGTGATGASCTFANECAAGNACISGRCSALCEPLAGSPNACDSHCSGASVGLKGGYGACIGHSCGGDSSACGASEGCYWAGEFLCGAAGAADVGATCSAANDCAPGLACLGKGDSFECRALCGGPNLPSCSTACSGSLVPLDEGAGISACL